MCILQVPSSDRGINPALFFPDKSPLQLAIGKRGQNSRLAAKLCGIKIDIHTVESYEDDIDEYEEDEIEGEE